tara:strand:+ start:190 stop:864 length:675 start_codon:yes stop_codon:yes gene_type:complete
MPYMADNNNPYRQKPKRLVPQGKTSKRLSSLTPDGLRKRVLDALPYWESYPRLFRKILILLPTHGDLESIADEVSIEATELIIRVNKRPSFAKVVEFVQKNGHYPKCATTGEYLKHANLVEQYANEMSVSAIINLETNAGQAPINHKIVDSAGWFANIEYDTERYRRQKQHALDKYEQKIDSEAVVEEVEEGLKPFVRDINPEENAKKEKDNKDEKTGVTEENA